MTAAAREIETASVGVRCMDRTLLEFRQFVALQGKNVKIIGNEKNNNAIV